jgi:hypothetical protein
MPVPGETPHTPFAAAPGIDRAKLNMEKTLWVALLHCRTG